MNSEVMSIDQQTSKKRLIGLDILKILSMFFIIIHHVSKHGMFYDNSLGFSRHVLTGLNALFLSSVNIFVFISSYLIIRKGKVSIKHYFYLYAQIVSYGLLTYFISGILGYNGLSLRTIINCFFPITNPMFWFCKEYLLLYLISPLLLKIVHNLNKKEYTITTIGILFLLLYCNIAKVEIIPFNSGFNVIWFIVLFLLAGYQFKFGINIKKHIFLILFIISSALSTLIIRNKGMEVNYSNFITIVQTLSAFNLLYDINIKNKFIAKPIKYISTCTLGIYLLHDGTCIQPFLYSRLFKTYKFFDNNILLYFFMFVFLIFVLGLIVESGRKISLNIIMKFSRKKSNSDKVIQTIN